MSNVPLMKENKVSFIGKAAFFMLLVLIVSSAIQNIGQNKVPNPYSFFITITGFLLFISAKISTLKQGILFSFGTSHMSENMANLYRAGYWLMVVGVLFTFN